MAPLMSLQLPLQAQAVDKGSLHWHVSASCRELLFTLLCHLESSSFSLVEEAPDLLVIHISMKRERHHDPP